jgi:hypothetical protein
MPPPDPGSPAGAVRTRWPQSRKNGRDARAVRPRHSTVPVVNSLPVDHQVVISVSSSAMRPGRPPGCAAPRFDRSVRCRIYGVATSGPLSGPRPTQSWSIRSCNGIVSRPRSALTVAGDDEGCPSTRTFLTAIEYGMPPSGGTGMGIDRLLMALMGSGIRGTIGVSAGTTTMSGLDGGSISQSSRK